MSKSVLFPIQNTMNNNTQLQKVDKTNKSEENKVINSIFILESDKDTKNEAKYNWDTIVKGTSQENVGYKKLTPEWEKLAYGNTNQSIEKDEPNEFSWKNTIYGNIDQSTLKEQLGKEQYEQYLKTIDRSAQGLCFNQFEKLI